MKFLKNGFGKAKFLQKKLILLFLVLSLLLVNSFAVLSVESCDIDISLINQEPYPAAPNSYVKLVFQVSGVENPSCGGMKFEFIPTYPFSLDDNEQALKVLSSGSTYVFDYNNNWMVAYKVRVDKDAIEGDNEVKIRYSTGVNSQDPYIENRFVVNIEDTRTTFDAVIQDVSASEVSIAIANVGKYTANSVVVRIPEQKDFKAGKTSGQMVGNLESGDYTLASFELTRNIDKTSLSEEAAKNARMSFDNKKETTLKFDIHYTDSIGERRIINMELPLMMDYFLTSEEAVKQIVPGGKSFAMGQHQSSRPMWQYVLIIAVVLLAAFMIYKKFFKGNKKRRNNKSNESDDAPDWANGEK